MIAFTDPLFLLLAVLIWVWPALLFGIAFLQHRDDTSSPPHLAYIFQARGAYRKESREEAVAILQDVISRLETDEEAKAALVYLRGLDEPVGAFVREIVKQTAEKDSTREDSRSSENDQ